MNVFLCTWNKRLVAFEESYWEIQYMIHMFSRAHMAAYHKTWYSLNTIQISVFMVFHYHASPSIMFLPYVWWMTNWAANHWFKRPCYCSSDVTHWGVYFIKNLMLLFIYLAWVPEHEILVSALSYVCHRVQSLDELYFLVIWLQYEKFQAYCLSLSLFPFIIPCITCTSLLTIYKFPVVLFM